MDVGRAEAELVAYIGKNIEDARIIWTVGTDNSPAFLRVLTVLTEKALEVQQKMPFDVVVWLQAPSLSTSDGTRASLRKGARMVADQLQILDEEDSSDGTSIRKLLDNLDNFEYYHYKESHVVPRRVVERIYEKLAGKKYLLVIEHLLYHMKVSFLEEEMGLPSPSRWNGVKWLISTPSSDVCTKSKSEGDHVLDLVQFKAGRQRQPRDPQAKLLQSILPVHELKPRRMNLQGTPATMIVQSLPHHRGLQLLMSEVNDIIINSLPRFSSQCKNTNAIMEMVINCLCYCLLFSPEVDVADQQNALPGSIQQEELVRYWMAEGLLTEGVAFPTCTATNIMQLQEEKDGSPSLFDTGKAILEALLNRFLVECHSPPHCPCIKATATICWCVEDLLMGEANLGPWTKAAAAAVPPPEMQEGKDWISFKNIQGRWLRKMPLTDEPRTLTTLILRGNSHIIELLDDLFQYVPHLRVLDLSYTPLTSLPSSLSHLTNLRLLSLKGCHDLITLTPSPSSSSAPPLPSPLQSMEKLEVLDLNGTLLVDIPKQVGMCKENLRFLDLSCSKLKSLSPDLFSNMPGLEEILLCGCTSLSDPSPSFKEAKNLRVFHLTGTQITAFPETTFNNMKWLRVLDLSNNHSLASLPESLSKVENLEELHLQDCHALKDIRAVGNDKLKIFSLSNNNCLMMLPESFSKAKGLQEIHLRDCRNLKDINAINFGNLKIFSLSGNNCLTSLPKKLLKATCLEEVHLNDCQALKEINLAGSANLRSFSLSRSPVVQVSLKSCQKLETINLHDLEELETLDLSKTMIKEFPSEILGLPRLKRLDLIAVQCLRRFPWSQIQWLPQDFNLDQCSCAGDGSLDDSSFFIPSGDDRYRARIYCSDSRFFYNFDSSVAKKLMQKGKCLERFYVCLSPCEARCKSISNRTRINSKKAASATAITGPFNPKDSAIYKDVCSNLKAEHHPFCRLDKHLEIAEVDRSPEGLRGLLDCMESLSMQDNRFNDTLTVMNAFMPRLKECQLKRCHNMQNIFTSNFARLQNTCLENLRISVLQKLAMVCRAPSSYNYADDSFTNLKYVHLEHCPRLEKVFPWNLHLHSLQTLSIKFCSNLKTVFYSTEIGSPRIKLQSLQTIHLLDLPLLLHLHENQQIRLPSWEVLQVRGCPGLHRLPFLGEPPSDHQGDQTNTATTSSRPSSGHASHQVVLVSGETRWWNNMIWDDEQCNYCKDHCFQFKPQHSFAALKHGMKKRPLV